MSEQPARVWKTHDGREVDVSDMATPHIENALAMLKRKGFVGPKTLAAYANGPGPSGDAARDAFNMELRELLQRPTNPFVDIFEDELRQRGATA